MPSRIPILNWETDASTAMKTATSRLLGSLYFRSIWQGSSNRRLRQHPSGVLCRLSRLCEPELGSFLPISRRFRSRTFLGDSTASISTNRGISYLNFASGSKVAEASAGLYGLPKIMSEAEDYLVGRSKIGRTGKMPVSPIVSTVGPSTRGVPDIGIGQNSMHALQL